ncbi:hypothetical protein GCM10028783_24650 [Modestobacter muralis]
MRRQDSGQVEERLGARGDPEALEDPDVSRQERPDEPHEFAPGRDDDPRRDHHRRVGRLGQWRAGEHGCRGTAEGSTGREQPRPCAAPLVQRGVCGG